MRLMRNVIKDRHGTYYARKKVPAFLQEAVARALGNDKARQVWLKRSLDTKDIETANRRAKAVLIEFDHTLDRARVLTAERPLVTSLSPVLIRRMADYYYAWKLHAYDDSLKYAPDEERALRAEFPDEVWSEPVPEFGLSGGQLADVRDNVPNVVREAEAALARGDIAHIEVQVAQALDTFQINLDHRSPAYQELGIALLRSHVKALRALQQRFAGEPIETPPLLMPAIDNAPPAGGETLKATFEGWKRDRERSPRTLIDYERATRLFIELHGDMPVAQIRRTQARQFREALQETPHSRTGKLLKASLPELARWGHEHPEAQKISPSTVNKLLGGVQAVCRWARKEHLLPDDWADPFAEMRLETDESDRAPFDLDELRLIFTTPVFTEGARPKGGQGAAAYWLPLLALFGGERLSELAGLRASDVTNNEFIGAVSIYIATDRKVGRRLKTKQSERYVPVHSRLIKLGFLDYVATQAKARGEKAWLFPLVAPDSNGAAAFSKWFGRYIGAHGVSDPAKVFHSFRHNFTDALRLAGIADEVKQALLGWTGGGMAARYGAKDKAARFRHKLSEAVESAGYPGLDLSRLKGATGREATNASVETPRTAEPPGS